MLPTNPLLNATAPAGPHLPVGLLRQYAAGTLAPAAQHRVEAHTLACPRCADILAGLQQTPPATTDQALAQLQQRLRQRVQAQAAPARYEREARRNRWLIPQLAAAAALLLGLVAGGWWAGQQRHLATKATEVATKVAPNLPAAPAAPAPTAAPPAAAPPATVAVAPAAPALPTARPRTSPARRAQSPLASPAPLPQGSLPPLATPDTTTTLATVAAEPAPAAKVGAPLASTRLPADSLRLAENLASRLASGPARKQVETYAAPLARMPAAPRIPPAPQGGYAALREKLRREATEFRPAEGEQSLSGTVQLRLTIGADGKIQQTKVLRGLRDDYDAEAQRLVCDGPGWVPGISGGKRAPLEIDIAVPF
ncbi:MAG TPA: energy transducer TonB [Hymenobacter sp.]|uniref:energy transducer TonB n=1 Tax=Hymenobacter sp. TaxID=1898978 RepID=UPI002D802F4C|nr:energy transducer TonB [Hymenobacter sp.]HET9504746.1 energy transducer TonB [Hymenobacter sp.]